MKILHVTKKYPDALGGDATVVASLERQQQLNNHHLAIITSNCDDIKNLPHIYKFGLNDTPARLDKITLRRIISLFMLFFKAFSVIKKERPDVIHTQSVDMAFVISLAARIFRIPIVHTFQIVTFYDPTQSMLRRHSELLLARLAGIAIATAPNSYDVNKLISAGLKPSVVLHNGIDLDFWHRDPAAKQSKVVTFITMGRLEKQKGIEYLIQAAALLRDRAKHPFKLLIVGTGSLDQSLRQLRDDLHLHGIVDFLGKKNREEVRGLLGKSHIAVFASLYETTPLTLLETLAMEMPVISTKAGILRDYEEIPAVRLVEMCNPLSLADAMDDLAKNESTRLNMASFSRKTIEPFSWPQIYLQTQQLYDKALHRK